MTPNTPSGSGGIDAVTLSPASRETRGGCLTSFLVCTIIGSSLAVAYFVFVLASGRKLSALLTWFLVVCLVGFLLNIYFAVAIWHWRRLGVYGYVLTTLTFIAIDIALVGFTPKVLGWLIGAAILCGLVRKKWQHMAP